MRNQVTRTASTRRSRFSIPSMDANSSVSSIFGSDAEDPWLSTVKFIPMAAMSKVSVAVRLDSAGIMRRLFGRGEVDGICPFFVGLNPGHQGVQLIPSGTAGN